MLQQNMLHNTKYQNWSDSLRGLNAWLLHYPCPEYKLSHYIQDLYSNIIGPNKEKTLQNQSSFEIQKVSLADTLNWSEIKSILPLLLQHVPHRTNKS